MGSRNRFIKRPKKKEEEKKYTTRAGRGSNRVAEKAKTAVKKLADIPASKRPKDMQAGKVYGDAGQPPAPKLPPKTTPPKKTPTKKTPPKKAPVSRKTAPKAATAADAQNLRSGPTPPKPTKSTKPAKKVYGSKGKKGLKQSSRMADALNNLKVRKYKK